MRPSFFRQTVLAGILSYSIVVKRWMAVPFFLFLSLASLVFQNQVYVMLTKRKKTHEKETHHHRARFSFSFSWIFFLFVKMTYTQVCVSFHQLSQSTTLSDYLPIECDLNTISTVLYQQLLVAEQEQTRCDLLIQLSCCNLRRTERRFVTTSLL